MMKTHRRERGATLLISLIMLVVLTMFALAGFNLSSVNLKIAGNFQIQRGMEAVAQQAIEQVLSTPTSFSPTAPVQVPAITVGSYTVTFPITPDSPLTRNPACNYYRTATGYGKDIETLAPEDTDWELRATVSDALTGAQATITQGVVVRLPKGNCPA